MAQSTAVEPTDAELVERLRTQDLDALGALFDRYYADVFRSAVVITQDNAAADDIAQEAFLRIHRYASRIDTSLPLLPWLYRVTVNLAFTWLSRQRKRRIPLDFVIDRLISPIWLAPDSIVENTEMQDRVRQAITKLTDNQRLVIVAHYMAELSLEEIAEAMHCPVGTVKSRLYYARENLRRHLESVQVTREVVHEYAR